MLIWFKEIKFNQSTDQTKHIMLSVSFQLLTFVNKITSIKKPKVPTLLLPFHPTWRILNTPQPSLASRKVIIHQ